MPTFEIGNMWEAFEQADRFIVLCSSTLDKQGRAILTRGMAGELVQRFPEANMPEVIGRFIEEACGVHGMFGLRAETKVGVFQDRRHHDEDTVDLYCFASACGQLRMKAEANPDLSFHVELSMRCPYWLIKGPVESCPSNVTFWSKP